MPSYTTSLRLVQPATGEYSGTWGTQVNNGITALVDAAVAGTASITMTAADYTLSNNNGTADEARAMFLVLEGTPGSSRFVIVPSVSKLYFVTNNTGFAQSVSTSGSGGVSVPNGASMTLRCDGTNVVEALNAFGNISYTGTLTGNTGVINIGSGQIYKDGSGNVGIGTSSPGAKLDVVGTIKATETQSQVWNGATGTYTTWQYNGTSLGDIGSGNQVISGGSTADFAVSSRSGNLVLGTGSNARATLDSSGNLGIGISVPQAVLHVNKATSSTFRLSATNVGIDIQSLDSAGYGLVATYTNHPLVFSTNSTERARITSGGDLLVGTTGNANNYKTHILTTGAGAAIGIFQNNATTPYGINVYYGAASPNNSNANTSFLYCNDLTTLRIQLASNGGVINYQANNSNLSDRREKTDFASAKSYLDTICSIPVQTFKYIDQTDDAPTLGVVAQDVQAVAPELVMESNWGTEDNPKMRLSIYQTDLQYALMKCIQELKAQNDELRARVAALEAK